MTAQLAERERVGCITLFSPAKLNLFFRILGKRPDHYHEIASMYQAIDIGDILTTTLADRDQLICDDPAIPTDDTNLILKAAALFRKKTNLPIFAEFNLKKRIPAQSGLGGGSSNAATALWALNKLSNYPATLNQLINWSTELGSDITFFLSKGSSYCTGRGEQITTKPSLKQPSPLTIGFPGLCCSTPAVYQAVDVTKCSNIDPQKLSDQLYSNTPCFINDLEKATFKLLPEMAQIKKDLLSLGFEHVCMTGSGSAFFCFGTVQNPVLTGVRFQSANFIPRSDKQWYLKS